MKKSINLLFAVAMMFSIVFISEAIADGSSPFAAKAQQVTVKRKRKGVARRAYGGGKYVARKTYGGAKYVGRKTYQGGKYVGKKTYQGGKYVGKKTVKGTRATISRTKKVLY